MEAVEEMLRVPGCRIHCRRAGVLGCIRLYFLLASGMNRSCCALLLDRPPSPILLRSW